LQAPGARCILRAQIDFHLKSPEKSASLFLIGKTLELSRMLFHVRSMKVKVTVMPKQSVLDPQGVAVRDAIHHHGMPQVKSVRIGKFLEIEIDGAADQSQEKLHELCRDLLSNPVIEDYQLSIEA
jgi:phosphoribosylformylglycinamidine synthase PurS subunit